MFLNRKAHKEKKHKGHKEKSISETEFKIKNDHLIKAPIAIARFGDLCENLAHFVVKGKRFIKL